jgi:heme exporter protein C
MHTLANPARFLRLAALVLPWAIAGMVLSLAAGLYLALVASPPDYKQGEMVRVMYVHVPAAWMAMGIYAQLVIVSIGALIWRHPLADVAAKSMAPIGALFTLICLITGSLWGRPTWGTYWVWDARLTSVLVLFFIYLGYLALWSTIDDRQKAGRAAAILAIIGGVNIPIIKFSVDWWWTLHQPASIIRSGGARIHADMQAPLFTMWLGYILFFVVMLIWRMRTEIATQRLEAISLRETRAPTARGILVTP